MKEYKIGYTQGVYDMFHIGHLNLLKQAKEHCDFLIVGVNSDRLVSEYKNKHTIISEKERAEIVSNIKCVDKCIIVDTLDKMSIWNNVKYDAIFIGSDWKDSKRWIETENQLKQVGVPVIYLQHTDGISSSIIKEKLFGFDS